MNTIEETVEVAVPVRTAYNQWTQFKSFPRFMSTVKGVEQIRPAVTEWVIAFGPVRRTFQAEIVRQAGWEGFGARFYDRTRPRYVHGPAVARPAASCRTEGRPPVAAGDHKDVRRE